jgi:uncharacterized protein (DUF486 family)
MRARNDFLSPQTGGRPTQADFRRLWFDRAGTGIHFCAMNLTESRWLPIVLLTVSNVFMTVAWYGHLKFKSKPLLLVILVSWGIAFFEYRPASAGQSLGSNSVYSAISVENHPGSHHAHRLLLSSRFFIFHEKIRWNHFAAFVCILAAVVFAFLPQRD